MTTAMVPVYRRSELEAISDGCLHRYRALWMDGVDDSSDISLLGIAFHAVNHRYLLRLVDRKLPYDAEEAQHAFIEGVAIAQLPARLIPELRQVWTFHASKFAFDPERFIAAEEMGSEEGVAWTPDLVQAHPESNALEVVDFKSGWHPPLSEPELRDNFQARVYSRYARDRWPNFQEYHFSLHAVRFNKRVTVSFSAEDLDVVDTEIQAAITTIELAKQQNSFPAIPGPACRFCQLACPVADQPLSFPKRLSMEQRIPVAGQVLVIERALKAAKKLLKESVTENGPIDLNGVVFDNRPSVSRSYPVDAILEGFKKLKIDRQAGDVIAAGGDLTISASALKKVIRLYPDLVPILEPHEKQKTTYRFGAKQAGVGEEEEE